MSSRRRLSLTEFPAYLGRGQHFQRLHRLRLLIYPAKSPIYSTIDSRVGVSSIDAHFSVLEIEIGERGIRKWKARRRSLFLPRGRTSSTWGWTWTRGAM